MSKNYALKAEKRDGTGKGVARALRRENKTPAVIYGDNKEPLNIVLPTKETTLEYHKGHMFTTLCDVDVAGEKHLVLARDIQLHPVSDNVLHVDFLRVTPKTKLNVYVPVHFTNQEECKGLQEKGILNVVRHEVELTCQATSIPEAVELDMTEFEIGDAIKMSHIALPSGAKPTVTDRDLTIATIVAPRRAIEETPAEEGEEGAAAATEGGEEAAEGGEGEKAEGGEE